MNLSTAAVESAGDWCFENFFVAAGMTKLSKKIETRIDYSDSRRRG